MRLKNICWRALWALLVLTAPGLASAQAELCAVPRAVVAGETALQDALSRGDGNAAPLLGALARIADQMARQTNTAPALSAYLTSRQDLAAILASGDSVAARRLMRTEPHQSAGQRALIALRADSKCLPGLSGNGAALASATRDGGLVEGGHGSAPASGSASATGNGRAAQPVGDGIATSPLSFLRGFDATWHIIPAIGATLAFGVLIFVMTRYRRQYRRYLCHFPVIVDGPTGQSNNTLLDISRGGAKLTRCDGWKNGTRVTIDFQLNTERTVGRIMWSNEGFVGVLFRKPLTTPEFQALLGRAKAGAGVARRKMT